MQNPHRVTPPLMSEDSNVSTSIEVEVTQQPAFSEPVEQQSHVKQRVESHVEAPVFEKKEHTNSSSQAAKASNSSINSAKKKVKKAPNAFRTISEVANELDVQQHVLRFWETKFNQVKPLKRGGGRRYYRPEDVAILKRIHHLLYTEGYTIKGVQKLLKGRGKSQIVEGQSGANNENSVREVAPAPQTKVQGSMSQNATTQSSSMSAKQRAVLEMMLAELKSMRSMIKA